MKHISSESLLLLAEGMGESIWAHSILENLPCFAICTWFCFSFFFFLSFYFFFPPPIIVGWLLLNLAWLFVATGKNSIKINFAGKFNPRTSKLNKGTAVQGALQKMLSCFPQPHSGLSPCQLSNYMYLAFFLRFLGVKRSVEKKLPEGYKLKAEALEEVGLTVLVSFCAVQGM